MKTTKLLTVACATLFSYNAFAELSQEDIDACKGVEENAQVVMAYRIVEKPISEVYEKWNYNSAWMAVIDEAYSQRAMLSPEWQEKQINKFGSKYFKICLKGKSQ